MFGPEYTKINTAFKRDERNVIIPGGHCMSGHGKWSDLKEARALKNYQNLVLVDVEARGISPVNGTMTEFGCVHFKSRATFHGRLYESTPDPENPAIPLIGEKVSIDYHVATDLYRWLKETVQGRPVMVSDNPAYDFMWIAGMFDKAIMENPFGHSARRISDFYAGLRSDWSETQGWKKLRVTRHDHNPVHDALGNAEALAVILGWTEKEEKE